MADANTASNAGILLSMLQDQLSQFRGTTTKAMVDSVLSDATINSIHDIFLKINTGFNVLIGVIVLLIIISIALLIYSAISDPSPIQIAHGAVALTLTLSVVVSFVILKLAFYGLDTILFENSSGVFRVVKAVINEKKGYQPRLPN